MIYSYSTANTESILLEEQARRKGIGSGVVLDVDEVLEPSGLVCCDLNWDRRTHKKLHCSDGNCKCLGMTTDECVPPNLVAHQHQDVAEVMTEPGPLLHFGPLIHELCI